MINPDLERLVNLLQTCGVSMGIESCDACKMEYRYLKSKIESQLAEYPELKEKAKKFDEEEYAGGDGLGNSCVTIRKIRLNELELQNKKLSDENKQLKEENTKFNSHFESQLEKLKSQFEQIQQLTNEKKQLEEDKKQHRKTLASLEKAYWEIIEKDTQKEKQLEQHKSVIEEIRKECNENIECYESLNLRHQENYECSKDDSYLRTINQNNEIISEYRKIKQILSQLGEKDGYN